MHQFKKKSYKNTQQKLVGEMFCAIRYHSKKFKKRGNTHGAVIFLESSFSMLKPSTLLKV